MLTIKCAVAAGVLALCLSANAADAPPANPPIPKFDIQAACRDLSMVPEARSVNMEQPDAIQHCVQAEQDAHTQLTKEWTRFSPADRKMCVGESKSGGIAPAYSELETCLQMTRDSRQLNNQQTGDNSGQGIEAAPAQAAPSPTAQSRR
jgi:hypothetical protein